MVRISTNGAEALTPNATRIQLNTMISRLHKIILNPDEDQEYRLRRIPYERDRVGTNLKYADSLLLRLEQDALNIKVQSKKREEQAELMKKRAALFRMSERLLELDEINESASEGEDILGEYTPSETDEQETPGEEIASEDGIFETLDSAASPLHDPEPAIAKPKSAPDALEAPSEPQSTLRSRHSQQREILFEGRAQSTGISTATTEALMTHNRTEQEALTGSMLKMAQKLKESSRAFASSLESEKGILDKTAEGLDKNESGMQAAQKRMGYLRTMTEGRGWWGRMQMYACIFGMWILAIVIVFVLPKLRFNG